MNDVGSLGESIAAKFLKKSKYKILERNIHLSHNEIDIIALNKKEGIIVFAEVKARSLSKAFNSLPFGSPAAAVTKSKQARTIAAARAYLSANIKLCKYQPRFDVIEVLVSKESKKLLKINHIENAFGV